MSLESGTHLGHHEILSPLGKGGMGEVYRARDTKLGREVAIKVLPAEVADDSERMGRFEREARVLASLNHPNIATLHGFETEGDTSYLVMELVEGETLADRIARGPIPADDAMALFLQIAEGLEAAHEKGVIHRDLKPANVVVSAEGRVKVLDFGLAKAMAPETVPGGNSELSASPTMTLGATQHGMILGTAAYMAPEQARGSSVDKRADVWAFGCCLLESLTGKRVFEGESAPDILASVLRAEPDLSALPAEASLELRNLVRRCLVKDPRHRLRDIGDARIELEAEPAEPSPPSATAGGGRRIAPLAVLAGGLVAAVAIGFFAGWLMTRGASPSAEVDPPRVRRAVLPLTGEVPLTLAKQLALSPDGSRLVFGGGDWPHSHPLALRNLDSFEIELLPGTEGALRPFFSPDSEWVAFFDRDELKKVSVRGGSPVVVCETNGATAGTWTEDGWIYFTYDEDSLARVPAKGGNPESLGLSGVYRPSALPGGRGVLITMAAGSIVHKDSAVIAHLSVEGEVKELLRDGYQASYVSSGHLVFMRGGGLQAVPFDLDRLEVSPPAISVLPGIWTDSIWALARYAVARDGTLVYVAGDDYARTVPTWIDRLGSPVTPQGLRSGESLTLPADIYNTFNLSPDRQRLAIEVAGAATQIHIFDRARRTFSQLAFDGSNARPVWSHDGSELFFSSRRDGKEHLFRKAVNGSGRGERLLTDEQVELTGSEWQIPHAVSPDGRWLIFNAWGHPERGADIWSYALDGEGDPQLLVGTEANEILPVISPDGRWLAFASNRAGTYEIFARPFPDVDRREWQISSNGGFDARWSPAGDELLWVFGSQILSVSYTSDPDFEPGSQRVVLDTDFHDSAGLSYDLSADGSRILVNRPAMALSDPASVAIVMGWGEELKRLVPVELEGVGPEH